MAGKSRRHLKVTQYLLAILPMTLLLVIILGFGLMWFFPSLQQMHLDLRKNLSKDLVRSAWTLADSLESQVEQGKITREEARDLFLFQIQSLRYGPEMKDYFWAQLRNGKVIAHPYQDAIDLSKYRDSEGRLVTETMNQIANSKAGEGFLEYDWQWKDDHSRQETKISFVKLFEPWDLVIGSGFYIHDAQKEFVGLTNEFARWMVILGLILLLLIMIAIRKTIHRTLLLAQKDQEIRISQHRFTNMAEHVDHGMAIFQGKELVFCNRRLCDILGTRFDPEESLEHGESTKVADLFAQCKRELAREAAQGSHLSTEVNYTTPQGRERFLDIRYAHSSEDKQSYMLVLDRTSIRQQEQELYQLSKIIHECPLSVVITDPDGKIEFANRFTSEVSGYSTTEMLGKKSSMFKSDQMPQSVYEDLWQTITSGNTWTGELLNRRKDDKLFWEYAVIAPLKSNDGSIERYFSIKADISNLKALEQDLTVAKDRAEESDRIKTSFLNSISHEIRTPLNAITGITGYLFNELPDNEDFRSCREMIDESVTSFTNLLNDLIYLSDLKKDVVFSNYNYANVDHLLDQVIKTFLANPDHAPKQEVRVLTNYDAAFSNKLIFSDPVKLSQLLGEFLANAAKYTDAGSITLGYNLKGDSLIFFVEDTGKGISDEDKPHVFKMFYHGNTHFVTQHKGTGVGLNLAVEIASLMGGKIWFESELGKGTTFYVSNVCKVQ